MPSRLSLVSRTWASAVREIVTDARVMQMMGLDPWFQTAAEQQAAASIIRGLVPAPRRATINKVYLDPRTLRHVCLGAIGLQGMPFTLIHV